MAELVLIDQLTTQSPDEEASFDASYVRLTVEEDSEVSFAFCKPVKLMVEEAFGNGAVSCKLIVNDLVGSLINVKPVEGAFLFKLYVGTTPSNYQTYELKMTDISMKNKEYNSSSNMQIEITLMSKYWHELHTKRESRGWKNKRISDVVEEFAGELGFEDFEIDETKNERRSIVCPYWTKLQMLNWCAMKAISPSKDTHYVFGPLPNNRFFFKTIDSLYENGTQDLLPFEPTNSRTFLLGGQTDASVDQEFTQVMKINLNVPYRETMMNGASGVTYGDFDFETGTYVKGQHKFSESNESHLSDWTFISEEDENYGYQLCNNSEEEAKSFVSKEAFKTQALDTTVRGYCDVQLGEVVELVIPVLSELLDTAFNEFYSGRYLVSRKRTVCNLENSTILSVFRLSRHGVNSPNINTLTQTQAGKK